MMDNTNPQPGDAFVRDDEGSTHDRESEPLRGSLDPRLKNAISIQRYSRRYGEVDPQDLAKELMDQTNEVSQLNSTRKGEELLVAQAITLDAIFNEMALKATETSDPRQVDLLMKIALRAQSQCRCVWDTIGKLKHPPNVSFIKQANVAGNQQVNNYAGESGQQSPSRTGENKIRKNELLEDQHGEWLDFGTPSEAGRADTSVETVGAVHRAKDS